MTRNAPEAVYDAVAAQPSLRNHHNTELRERAASVGLIMTNRGYTKYEPQSPFMDLLSIHGVRVPELPEVAGGMRRISPPGSKLIKWSCQCTNVRVAVDYFRARCLNCGQEFVKQD